MAQVDTTQFKCFKLPEDGSVFYGEVAFLNTKTNQVVIVHQQLYTDQIPRLSGPRVSFSIPPSASWLWMQIYNGSKNEDGVLTKYEGQWDKDKKHGNGVAVFKDGSIYTGSFKKDHFEGQGKFEWALGHFYEGSWRESQMDGQGEFVHSNGRALNGIFKRNYYLADKCFINPLDDEKKQKRNIRVFDEQVLANKEKVLYDKRVRLYKVSSVEQLLQAVKESKEMLRVPVFIRTQQCQVDKDQIKQLMLQSLSLPDAQEINLRQIFIETYGNPLKKQEQRHKLHKIAKISLLRGHLLFLNLDDHEYPESLSQNMSSSHTGQQQAVGFDPNIKEFSGTHGLPSQLWTPKEFQRKELLCTIGMIDQEEEFVPDISETINFMVWSKYVFKDKSIAGKVLQRVEQDHQKELQSSPSQIMSEVKTDESSILDSEVIEKFERRFGKSLPLDCVNIILLMEMKN